MVFNTMRNGLFPPLLHHLSPYSLEKHETTNLDQWSLGHVVLVSHRPAQQLLPQIMVLSLKATEDLGKIGEEAVEEGYGT
ncbi:hypothetical protein HYFRA_00004977 [Hymenoscyphus fraxineus]|uniref:Uncharacterized protein n=1 Tax=Hymenoscyphus fraxineus TaxID=746836 RepID=A0A9N9KLV3_9HELO|nr:hypothetical protein HYFRA_00004977 [Hymenoscyphus fraxineus]